MNKIVILHNSLAQASRDFVEQYGQGYQIIDWYNQELNSDMQEYFSKELPGPSAFPCVVDTELKLIYNSPSSMQVALDAFAEYPQKLRECKLQELRNIRDGKLTEVDLMVNELALGLRSDAQAIATYRQVLKDITSPYKNQDGTASTGIDAIEMSSFEWPEKP